MFVMVLICGRYKVTPASGAGLHRFVFSQPLCVINVFYRLQYFIFNICNLNG